MKTHADRAGRSRLRIGLLVALAVTLLLLRPAAAHLTAASLLIRFADPAATGALASFGTKPVKETDVTLTGPKGPLVGRIYTPEGAGGEAGAATTMPGVVIVHGIHRLGINEPRLVRFARAVSASGVIVFTPAIRELAEYRLDAASVETIGASAKAFRERLGGPRVGIIGMSFAGGLALLAAADPRYADDVKVVVAVGAHHDLGRVARFLVTNRVELPDGRVDTLAAHEYGAIVLIYSNIESFFPAPDTEAAREIITLRLHEDHEGVKAKLGALSPALRTKIDALFEHKLDVMEPELTRTIERLRLHMANASPNGRLASLKAPVYLLHGAGDTVIPAAETLWLAKEVPPALLREALVSPAIVHVEMDGDPPLSEKWALVRFMTGVLSEADASE